MINWAYLFLMDLDYSVISLVVKTASIYNGFQTIFGHNGRRNSKKGRKLKFFWFPSLNKLKIQGLIFFVEFQELSHLRRDLSHAEKKGYFVTSWANAQNDIYLTKQEISLDQLVLPAQDKTRLDKTSISVKMVEVVILLVAQLVTTSFCICAWD